MRFRVASLFAMALSLGASPNALAADSWTGWHVGANAGYAWGHSDVSTNPACGFPNYFNCINRGVLAASGTGSLSPRGFTGGVQAGYNFQKGSFVLGGEVDFGAFNLKASRTGSGVYLNVAPPTQFFTSTTISTDWLFTARGRLGLAVSPSLLFYATGGLALADIKSGHSFADGLSATGAIGSSRIKAGSTVGLGAELMVAGNWTVKAEYLYVDFGSVSAAWSVMGPPGNPAVSAVSTSVNLTANIARVGVNYKFN